MKKFLLIGAVILCYYLLSGQSTFAGTNVLKAGDHVCSLDEFTDECQLLDRLSEIAQQGKPLAGKKGDGIRAGNRLKVLVQEAAYLMVSADDRCRAVPDREGLRSDFERLYARTCLRRKGTFARLRGELSSKSQQRTLDRVIDEKVRVESCIQALCSNTLVVTEAEVTNTWRRTLTANEIAVTSNAWKRAFAQNLRERILKGEDFGKLADQYSEEPHMGDGGDWGICSEETLNFDTPETARKIMALQDGELSPVLETGDGYELFKMIKRVPPHSEENPNDDMQYHVARLVLRGFETFEAQDPDEIRSLLQQRARERAQERFFTDLVSRHPIEVVAPVGVLTEQELKILKKFASVAQK